MMHGDHNHAGKVVDIVLYHSLYTQICIVDILKNLRKKNHTVTIQDLVNFLKRSNGICFPSVEKNKKPLQWLQVCLFHGAQIILYETRLD